MSKDKVITNKISIYLIKEGIKENEILKDFSRLQKLCKNETSITYYLPTIINHPKWLISYFNKDNIDDISVSNSKVISIHKINIDGKDIYFAIPFGNGKYLLNDDVIEEQFGIKVLLNSISKNEFRQLITSNYGGNHRTKNEQMPKKTDITEFGFDIHTDFLRKATAKCDEELFNSNTITGGDLLNVCVPVNYENIDEFLIKCYEKYKLNNYKKDFAWLDNIKEVKQKNLKNKLDEELTKIINRQEFDRVWAAVPENIEWEKVKEFRYKLDSEGKDDIEIIDILNLYINQTISNVDALKRKRVYAISLETEDSINDWSLYNCIIAEIDYEKSTYCLTYGKWYKVNDDFVKEINDYYNDIVIVTHKYPNNPNYKEGKYNELLSETLKDSILMDKETVKINGMGRSSIEVCDVLTRNQELIHVKKNGGSSYLSHLFNQASVSGEMLLDPEFRSATNKKLNKEVFDERFSSKDYTIILAIITNKDIDRPKIPFFSKVSIRYAIDGLQRKGYKVKIANIFNSKE